MKELKEIKDRVLAKLDYAKGEHDYMPERLKTIYEEVKEFDKNYKEFGYATMGSGIQANKEKKQELENFVNSVSSIEEKINIYLEFSDNADFKKFIDLESIDEILKVKNNQITEKRIKQADTEMGFHLHSMKSKLSTMIPKEKEILVRINELMNPQTKSEKKLKI